MSSFRIRPRFKHIIKEDKEELERSICASLAREKRFVYYHLPGHIVIMVNPASKHLWSPQLDLSFEQDGENVIVRGLYGPNPTLWALFFLGYAFIGILSLFVGIWGFSVWSLGRDATMLWLVPGFAAAALILYFLGQTGQKLGAQQMFEIHHFYEEFTRDKVMVS